MNWRELKQKLIKDNKTGDRLKWVREAIGLSQLNVTQEVPRYRFMEYGEKTSHYETILFLAMFFDFHWQRKFKSSFPEYDGKEIRAITTNWLMYGSDLTAKKYELRIKEMQDKHIKREKELLQRIAEIEKRNSIPRD